jgi:cytochrome c biogenesis protein CcdA
MDSSVKTQLILLTCLGMGIFIIYFGYHFEKGTKRGRQHTVYRGEVQRMSSLSPAMLLPSGIGITIISLGLLLGLLGQAQAKYIEAAKMIVSVGIPFFVLGIIRGAFPIKWVGPSWAKKLKKRK